MADAEAKDSDHHISPSPSIFSNYKLLDALPNTLGAAALELHYAKIVLQIERLQSSPLTRYILCRDKLYSMLPSNVRVELSERLPSIQSLTSSVLQDVASERKVAIVEILQWLVPLARSTQKWHSMRKYQRKAYVSRSHVLLVQTLYFVNQQKSEATIVELLVGLHYMLQAKLAPQREKDRLRRLYARN